MRANREYASGDFAAACLTYTEAIRAYRGVVPEDQWNDQLAILYGNRGAALLTIGALAAAHDSCRRGVRHVGDLSGAAGTDRTPNDDGGPVLAAKLWLRMARASLKSGNTDGASKALQEVFRLVNQIKEMAVSPTTLKLLDQMQVNARKIVADVELFLEYERQSSFKIPESYTKLRIIEESLNIAPGCEKLYEKKVFVLSFLNRWEDILRCLQKYAIDISMYENIYVEDLKPFNPHPGIPQSKLFLSANEIDAISCQAATDIATRIPFSLTHAFLRALRLEEKLKEANHVIIKLFVDGKHAWLRSENKILDSTINYKSNAAALYKRGDYGAAHRNFTKCLEMDMDSSASQTKNSFSPGDAGGRIHAVLFCNRAACLMQLGRFAEALKDCTSALKINDRYLKALLRRARCYASLDMKEKALRDFKSWMHSTTAGAGVYSSGEISEENIRMVENEIETIVEAELRAKQEQRRKKKIYEENFNMFSRDKKAGGGAKHTRFNDPGYQRRNENFNYYEWQSRQSKDSFHSEKARKRNGNGGGNPSNSSTRFNSGSSARNDAGSAYSGSNYSGSTQHPHVSPNLEKTICHYKLLGLDFGCDNVSKIKKSYHKLALKYHPDKNKDDKDAGAKFQKVREAYEILTDPKQKERYDYRR